MKTEKIVLASASPRRLELLHMLGFSELTVCPAQGEEKPPVDASPEEIVKALSLQKALIKRNGSLEFRFLIYP